MTTNITELAAQMRGLAAELDMPQIPSKKCQHGSAIAMRQAADALEAAQAEVARLRASVLQEQEECFDLRSTKSLLLVDLNAALARLAEIEAGSSPQPVSGMVVVPDYRGYAHLGTGQYVINTTDKPNAAELVISIASEAEKANRQIGERRNNPERLLIQPEEMCVRIRFANERGLFALEDQLSELRREHFPAAGASPVQPTELQAANEELITALADCRDAFPVPDACSELFSWWTGAMADPLAVPDYVKACVGASPVQPDEVLDPDASVLQAAQWPPAGDMQPSQDADPNAPWLSDAHMLCADQGIPPGHITDRIRALRDKLEQSSQALGHSDADRYRWCIINNMILAGGSSFGWPVAPVGKQWSEYIDAAINAKGSTT